MPGSSILFAILRCFNARALHSDKPQSLTIDAEMVIGFLKAGPVVAKVILNGCAVERTSDYYSIQRKDQTQKTSFTKSSCCSCTPFSVLNYTSLNVIPQNWTTTYAPAQLQTLYYLFPCFKTQWFSLGDNQSHWYFLPATIFSV